MNILYFEINEIPSQVSIIVLQAPKGKPPTKGSKQILVENAATVKFYRNMSMAATSFYGIITALFYYENISNWVLVSKNNATMDY